mgnify:CR=1 FL=1
MNKIRKNQENGVHILTKNNLRADAVIRYNWIEKNLEDSIEFAIYNLDKFIQPISDLRGSSFYRLEAMKGLFKRLQICLKQDKESLSIMEV